MRKLVPLSPRLDGELESYVAAARANAGTNRSLAAAVVIGAVGLSIAPPLNAEIVYTPANETVGSRPGVSTLKVDLNNDGTPDLVLSAYNFKDFSSHVFIIADLSAAGLQGNEILDTNNFGAAAESQGRVIGTPVSARVQFRGGGIMAFFTELETEFGGGYRRSSGLWLDATNRYLGVKFSIDGETHYGWVRMNASAGFATVTGYAYETIPDKPIRAGILPTPEANAAPQRPATLGVLAMGAVRHSD